MTNKKSLRKKFGSLKEGKEIFVNEYALKYADNRFLVYCIEKELIINDKNEKEEKEHKFLSAVFPVGIGSEESLLEHVLNQMKKGKL